MPARTEDENAVSLVHNLRHQSQQTQLVILADIGEPGGP